MGTTFEDLKILQDAENIADDIWNQVNQWKPFAREVVGKQLARAADSIGANIAEAFGRFHYGEKLNFLYYARGSLFETKYWLNRALKRQLLTGEQQQTYANHLATLARQLNAFANGLKAQRKATPQPSYSIRETATEYVADHTFIDDNPVPLFDINDFKWLESLDSVDD